MGTGDPQEQGQQGGGHPPPPPVAPPSPGAPPVPAQAPPAALPPLVAWLRAPRPEARPGIWRCGHQARPELDPDRAPTRQIVVAATVSFLVGWLLWSLLWNGYLGSYWIWPLAVLVPDSWRDDMSYVVCAYLYYALVLGGIVVFFGRLGQWPELLRRIGARLRGPEGVVPAMPRTPPPPPPHEDPALWPELRAAGAVEAAERLTAELQAGRMSDVDQARLARAWQAARAQQRGDAFGRAVVAEGAAACPHGSRQRDLPARVTRHDLVLRQVHVGTAVDSDRNAHEYRGAGIALDPGVLGTSALVVGPAGSGKTSRLVRPTVESLCLQALSGQAAVISVTSGSSSGGDEAYDVVVRLGDPGSPFGLDLYGGVDDPDEAAAMLAEALVGDLTTTQGGGDSRRAATVLAQLVGPFQALHGRFPDVPELRELLEDDQALRELRGALEAKGGRAAVWVRELDALVRQASRAGEIRALMGDRVALLDRPAFEGFFTAPGAPPATHRPFSVRSLDRPVRARIVLPERGHAEASRVLARLILAQFTECAAARADQSLFAGLVMDDAAQVVTPQALRGLQRLRSVNAGAMLTLRGLDEVPEHLRGPLLGAVGCRMVCAGVSTWDAQRFAEVWGTEWVETRTVTNRQLVSDEPFTKFMHGVRKIATGRYVSAESVTVKREQRQRWSASELANDLSAGHAVLSFTTIRGERTPPILTQLGG
ncbi:ATP-binding protein [Streptomyces axinellae]|uniref:ATP-binding protein n=1 Tax=Streptomyces axinellae TaxID=552788 RepID=A0ABP6DES6_9ACTN